ncbi:MAG TPA: hypothetical protein VJO33_02920, partial [Gemmatimonadaceae bacterium]|nr:hypothetical protein [Gemmatimonadaceae bacterium]
AQHGVVAFRDSATSPTALVSAVAAVASAMEDVAFFRLAHSLLSALLIVLPDSEILLRGRAIAHQARLARHLGETASAHSYYEEVERLGSEAGLPELTGRAFAGFGILAQIRGDFPEARRKFHSVIQLKGAAPESLSIAHHQLMVAAAAANEYDTAAMHAWRAFKDAAPSQESEALINLAQLLFDAGHPRAALRGFAAVLVRKLISRHALPALGGAACAAAVALPRPAARALVKNFAERLDCLVTSLRNGESLPYPSASALVEMSEALAHVGEEGRARDVASRADVLASSHGYYQLVYRLENPTLVAPKKPAAIHASTSAIIAAVDELEGAELVGAAS